jgi:ABC-type multidrug transport system ATPase subunit
MTVRLGFAVATALDPDVLILDEVLAVGDASFQAKCLNTLADLRKRGVPFILVSHNIHQIERNCTKVLYLEKGENIFYGNVNDGVSVYSKKNSSNELKNNKNVDWSVVLGSGKVIFTGAKFLDENSKEIRTATVGKPIIFSVDYFCKSPDVREPVFDVSIYSQGQQIFQATNKTKLFEEQSMPQTGKINVLISNFLFNEEIVYFYCCLHDKKTNEIFDWKRRIPLRIQKMKNSNGIFAIEHDIYISR